MSTPCVKDTVSPATNDSPLKCNCKTYSECVIRETSIAYLSLPADSTMDEIIDAIVNSLQDARTRLAEAETTITSQAATIADLESRVTALETL